jgi:DNA-binding winged helix-turn-helix (wHTH) protein
MAVPDYSDDAGEPVEKRGFVLYVGLSESKARESGVELGEIVDSLKRDLSLRVPIAESHALAVVGPVNGFPHDLDAVLYAMGETAPERVPEQPKRERNEDDIGVVVDLARHRVLVDDLDAHLTFKEFVILQLLVSNDGTTLSREQLREVIATNDEVDVHDRTIDVHIRRLRVKLGAYPDVIRTVHGHGYRFDHRRDVSVVRLQADRSLR